MKIIENFLPEESHKTIVDLMCGNNFSWFWNDTTNDKDIFENTFQLNHIFYWEGSINSDYFKVAEFILNTFLTETKTNIKNIFRIKANLLPRQPYTNEDVNDAIHKDWYEDDNHLTFIYYPIGADEEINIYDEDKKTIKNSYKPKANSIVYFKSNLFHGTSPPIKNKKRICINFVVEV